MPTVGIIGIGNMGNAILHGILDAGYVKAPNLVLYDPKIEILEKLSREQPSITYCDHALELARISDVIILAVKPNIVASVIDSISPALKEKAVSYQFSYLCPVWSPVILCISSSVSSKSKTLMFSRICSGFCDPGIVI